jgi:hypothetical protein
VNATGTHTNVSCFGACDAAVSVTPSGGTPPYAYSWIPISSSSSTVTGLCAGSYTLVITDANGCTLVRSFVLTQPSQLNASITSSGPSCNGGNNGSAAISVSGGTPAYAYSWSPAGGSNATATGLGAGTYTCFVTDAHGCTLIRTVTLTQPSAFITGAGQTPVSCNGGSNGVASVVIMGGTAPYSYSWSAPGGTTATLSNLAAGTYTCTMTDANGCSAVQVVTVTQPSAVQVNVLSHTNVSCAGGNNGSASVSASGGVPAYTYSWLPYGGSSATATGLIAGTYTCTVTDSHGCTRSASVTITQPPQLFVTASHTNVSCFGGNNGTATVSAGGGTPSYTYSWAPSGGNGPVALNLPAGTYTCFIRDANNCGISTVVTITQPSTVVTLSFTSTPACFGNGGTATVNPSGGTWPYTYSWVPGGQTNQIATNLATGNYSCVVTDANGCTRSGFVFVNNSGVVLTGNDCQVKYQLPNSFEPCTLIVNASGGVAPYSYSWSPAAMLNSTTLSSPTVALTSSGTFTYTVTVTDANGCSNSLPFVVHVIDARCGHHLNLVKVCTNNGVQCMSLAAANSYIQSFGGHYGPCSPSPCLSQRLMPDSAGDAEGYLKAAPNPFGSSTILDFGFGNSGRVSIRLFDLSGKELFMIFEGEVTEHLPYSVELTGEGLSPGIYLVELREEASGAMYHIKLVVEK